MVNIFVLNSHQARRGHDDGGTRARREAPERRGEWGLARGAVAPPQYGDLGPSPQKIFEKSTLKLHIFLWF